jgi:hypothetical protein
MVQFLSTLQEAPRVFSDAISEACTTHSWEIFCCFSGRILAVYWYTRYSPFYFASHIFILLTAHLLTRHSIRSGPQFISLISLVTSCQLPYHIAFRCLSKPTFIRATDRRHMAVKQTATLLFSIQDVMSSVRCLMNNVFDRRKSHPRAGEKNFRNIL